VALGAQSSAVTAVTRLAGALLVVVLAGCSAPDREVDDRVTIPARTPAPAATASSPAAPATSATSATSPASTTRRHRFVWQVRPATRATLGSSWRPGCPVAPAELRIVRLTFWTFDGDLAEGDLVLNRDVVDRAHRVFATMYRTRFPMRSVRPVTAYGSSDDRSMAADNTSAFNCRRAVAAGPPTWSNHAYGRAIDINDFENPYVASNGTVYPSRYFLHRRSGPGVFSSSSSAAVRAFTRLGFSWGGRWRSTRIAWDANAPASWAPVCEAADATRRRSRRSSGSRTASTHPAARRSAPRSDCQRRRRSCCRRATTRD